MSLTPLRRHAGHRSTPADSLPAPTTPIAVDIPIPLPPATTGACRASTAARLQRQADRMEELQCATQALDAGDGSAHTTIEPHERIHLVMTPDGPRPSVDVHLSAARSEGLANGMRIGALRRSYWDICVGLMWGAVLGMLCTMFGSWLGLITLPADTAAQPSPAPAGPTAPAERGGSTVALAMLVAAVPPRRDTAPGATRGAAWWTDAPHRACEVCALGNTGAAGRVCTHDEVKRYAGGQPVPVAHARAADGMCGTDARHHVLG